VAKLTDIPDEQATLTSLSWMGNRTNRSGFSLRRGSATANPRSSASLWSVFPTFIEDAAAVAVVVTATRRSSSSIEPAELPLLLVRLVVLAESSAWWLGVTTAADELTTSCVRVDVSTVNAGVARSSLLLLLLAIASTSLAISEKALAPDRALLLPAVVARAGFLEGVL